MVNKILQIIQEEVEHAAGVKTVPQEYVERFHSDPQRYGYRVGKRPFDPSRPPEKFVNFRGGRGTGHFGTGWYFVGKNSQVQDIVNHPSMVFDLQPYNLFKITSPDQGYNIHDTLRNLTNKNILGVRSYIAIKQFKENKESWLKEFIANYLFDPQKVDNILKKYDFLESREEYVNDAYDSYYRDVGRYNRRDSLHSIIEEFGEYFKKWAQEEDQDLKDVYLNDTEKIKTDLEQFVDKKTDKSKNPELIFEYLSEYIDPLVKLVSQISGLAYDQVYAAAINTFKEQMRWDAYKEKDFNKDIFSTRFFTRLGFDGIDVRGTRLDNTEFGNVIWNIKPEDVYIIKYE